MGSPGRVAKRSRLALLVALGTIVVLSSTSGRWPSASARGECDGSGPVDLVADALEVTQGVQDGSNTVPLVDGKRTYVRLYGHVEGDAASCRTTAELVVDRDGTSTTLAPLDPGGEDVVAAPVDRFARSVAETGFLFELPSDLRTGAISLRGRINPNPPSPPESSRSNNEVAGSFTFGSVPRPRIFMQKVNYTLGGTPHKTTQNHVDQALDWLRRAFPIDGLASSVSTLIWEHPRIGFDRRSGRIRSRVLASPSCRALNRHLYLMSVGDSLLLTRHAELFTGSSTGDDGLDRWYAMVTDTGEVMSPACAFGIPSIVASGGTGATGPTRPYAWDTDGSWGDFLSGHELGHTFGRHHWPYCEAATSVITPTYAGGLISPTGDDARAVVGFDVSTRKVYDFAGSSDLMTYCENRWLSDITYRGLMAFFREHGSATSATSGTRAATSNQKQPNPQPPPPPPPNPPPPPPPPDPDLLPERLIVVGTIDGKRKAHLEPVYRVPTRLQFGIDAAGKYATVLRGADGAELARYPFDPVAIESAPLPGTSLKRTERRVSGSFVAQAVPFVPGTKEVQLVGPRGKVLSSQRPGTSDPTVSIRSVVRQGGTVHLDWTSSDQDGDALTHVVQYSTDGGASWAGVHLPTIANRADVPRDNVRAASNAIFRVLTSDGVNTAIDNSVGFAVSNEPPTVKIVGPKSEHEARGTIGLEAIAYDVDDGSLDDGAVQWSSDRQGTLGEGAQLSVVLEPGRHLITVQATDSSGATANANSTIDVAP